jgi:hypothetical protein
VLLKSLTVKNYANTIAKPNAEVYRNVVNLKCPGKSFHDVLKIRVKLNK